MSRIELINNGVEFLEEPHEYWLTLPTGEKKQLFGITDVIKRNIECAKHEYDNCPSEWLIKQAGKYGHDTHEDIRRLIQDFEHSGTVEVQDFIELTKDMHIEASEYNVSDMEHWSSNIDCVFRVNDNTFDLGDIKTYAGKLTKTQRVKAQWQLSIYAYLFELQNPMAKTRDLFIIHVRNKMKKDGIMMDHQAEIVPVERIPSSICKELLDCDLNGQQFKNPYDIPKEISSQINRIIKLMDTKKRAEEELNAIKQNVYQTMCLLDQTSWQTNDIRFTRTADSVRSSFDLKAFQKDHPEFDYDQYMKVSQVAGSLRIAI